MKLSKPKKHFAIVTLTVLFCMLISIGAYGDSCSNCDNKITITTGQDTTGHVIVNKQLAGNAIPDGAEDDVYPFSLTGADSVDGTVTPGDSWEGDVDPGHYTIEETDSNGAAISYSAADFNVDANCTRIYASATLPFAYQFVPGTLSYSLKLGGTVLESGPVAEDAEVDWIPDEAGTYTWTFSWNPLGFDDCGSNCFLDDQPASVEVTLADPTEITITNTWNSGTPETGTLVVVKSFDGTATSHPDNGFVVDLNDDPKDIVSGENTFSDLATGSYTVEETTTNGASAVQYSTDGSTWGDTPVSVDVTAGETATVYVKNTFNIVVNPGTLVVVKSFDGTATSHPDNGFVVTLNPSEQTKNIVAGENTFNNLEAGTYTVEETTSNGADAVQYSTDGSTWGDTPVSAVVPEGQSATVYIKNTYNNTPSEGASIRVVKQVTGTNAPDDDALFDITLYKYNSETENMDVYETFQLADDGSRTFDVDPGTYEVVEGDVDYDHFKGVTYSIKGRFEIDDKQDKTVTVTNRFTNGGGGDDGDSSSSGGGDGGETVTVPEPTVTTPPVVTPPVLIPEPIIVPEPLPELPKTGANSILLMGMGLLLAGGGIVMNRFRK